jgi:hypothetical protein
MGMRVLRIKLNGAIQHPRSDSLLASRVDQ